MPMENLPLIFKRYTSENGGKELLGAVELRLELPGETDVRLGITAITFLVDWGTVNPIIRQRIIMNRPDTIGCGWWVQLSVSWMYPNAI